MRIVTVLCLSLRKHFKGATCSISSSECTDWIECYLLGLSRVECYLPGLPTCTRSSVTLKDSCLFLYFIARDFLAPRQTVASRKIRSVTLHVLFKRNREFARKTYSGSTGCVRFFFIRFDKISHKLLFEVVIREKAKFRKLCDNLSRKE